MPSKNIIIMAGNEVLDSNSEEFGESGNALEVLSEVDIALAYLPEKLSSLENLLTLVVSRESDIKADDVETGDTPTDFIEKAFAFHLLYAILNFELRELSNFISYLQDLIVETLRTKNLYDSSPEFLVGVTNRLHGSEDLLRCWQERVVLMNIRLAKLQMTSFLFKHNDDLQLETGESRPKLVRDERRLTLRMLEISLSKEMELEKKLSELKQTEEDLRLKIHLTEQVSAGMEEAAEVAWGRFLESDNATEVWMGISKEMLRKLQTANGYGKDSELEIKLQDFANLLNEKENSIQKLNGIIQQLVSDNAEVTSLKERVKMLEEKLKESESQLAEAMFSSTRSQQQLKEMGVESESLRENLFSAETRAANAEEKVTHLTESNLELTEELDFLKGSSDSLVKKASMLEKQVTEFDIQLEHARASSEASQEQQSMLYTAIFDMETLIDELKQKVSKAEINAESAEERCVILSETNSELRKELDFLRLRMESAETSLNQDTTTEKGTSAEDVRITSTIIMDMVLQIAMERERIHKKLTYLTKENRLLREGLWREPKCASTFSQNKINNDDKDEVLPVSASVVKATEISSESSEVDNTPHEADSLDENGRGCSDFPKDIVKLGINDDTGSSLHSNKSLRSYESKRVLKMYSMSSTWDFNNCG